MWEAKQLILSYPSLTLMAQSFTLLLVTEIRPKYISTLLTIVCHSIRWNTLNSNQSLIFSFDHNTIQDYGTLGSFYLDCNIKQCDFVVCHSSYES